MPASRSRRSSVDGARYRASERVNRKRSEHDTRNQSEGAVKRSRMETRSGFAGQRTCIQMQPSFRGQFAHGQSPTRWPRSRIRFEFRHVPFANVRIEGSITCATGEYRSGCEAIRNPKKRYLCSERVKCERKILREWVQRESYSFEFSRSGTGSAGMPDTALVNVLLEAAFFLEVADKADRFIGRTRAMLGDDVDQRTLNVLRHSLGIAADVDVSAFGKP
jgi:hypothetical protein